MKHAQLGQHLDTWKGPEPDTDRWIELGKPECWFLEHDAGEHRLYQDRAYGTLALTKGRLDLIVALAKDFVSTDDSKVIGLGPYYLGDRCRIYKEA